MYGAILVGCVALAIGGFAVRHLIRKARVLSLMYEHHGALEQLIQEKRPTQARVRKLRPADLTRIGNSYHWQEVGDLNFECCESTVSFWLVGWNNPLLPITPNSWRRNTADSDFGQTKVGNTIGQRLAQLSEVELKAFHWVAVVDYSSTRAFSSATTLTLLELPATEDLVRWLNVQGYLQTSTIETSEA